ncbi:AsmA family protein [Uliginosibacterium sp. TH139]|uniref:AsmA family protein n=1 Tax=Uliginosibacterium sp. TH139 TaxID=2067453 RepID=UPI0013040450|nr:AsmA family protein [Uliginosibacterium sp. TH139]
MKIRLAILLRVLGFTLGGIMAVVAALAMWVWISFDAEHTAQALTRHFKDVHQRGLLMSQPPQLSIWPRPALLLKRASLTEAGRSEAFASVTQLRLELATLPLLQGIFELRGVRVTGLSVRLQRNRKGEWNFTDLIDPPASAGLPEWQLRLERLRLDEARFAIERQGSNERILLRGLQLDASLPAGEMAGKLSWQGELSEAASTSELKFRGDARLKLQDGLSSGSLDELHTYFDGNSHGLQGATLQLDAQRLLWARYGREGSLADLQARLRGAAGAQALDFNASAPDLGWLDETLQGRDFQSTLALRTVDGQSELRLNLPEMQATAPRGFHTAQARFDWKQQYGKTLGSEGQLKLDLYAEPLSGLLRAERVAGEIGLQHPRLHTPAARARLDGSFSLQAGNSELTLQALLGEDALQLKARLQQLWPLSGRFELGATRLDVDRLLAEARPGNSLPPLTLPALDQHSLGGSLKLAHLRIGGVEIASLQSPLLIDKGQLNADGFLARIHGGEVSGKLLLEPASSRVSLQGDFTALPLSDITRESSLPLPLGGQASGSYRLGWLQQANQAPLATLSGAIRWNLTDATLQGVDLERSLQELGPAISAGRMSARSPAADERSELGSANSRFVFEQGKLAVERIETRSKWLKLGGSGQADLPRGEMDFSLQAELLPAAPRELTALRGKPIPLRLKGPLLHPDLRYEPGTARPTASPAKK